MTRGIDYSGPGSNVNRDPETGIRYGVIPIDRLGEFAHESFEPEYDAACPACGEDWPEDLDTPADCPACGKRVRDGEQYGDEPSRQRCDSDGVEAALDSSGDAWFFKSPYFTRAAFCSPCAPGACYLTSPCDDGERCYCPGPDWFDEDNPAPFPIYSVATGERVATSQDPCANPDCPKHLDGAAAHVDGACE